MTRNGGAHASPGMHRKHYSPATPLLLVKPGAPLRQGRGAYLWISQPVQATESVRMPRDAVQYAAVLYETLHRQDTKGWDWIAVEMPPDSPEWAGIRDRLERASSPA